MGKKEIRNHWEQARLNSSKFLTEGVANIIRKHFSKYSVVCSTIKNFKSSGNVLKWNFEGLETKMFKMCNKMFLNYFRTIFFSFLSFDGEDF